MESLYRECIIELLCYPLHNVVFLLSQTLFWHHIVTKLKKKKHTACERFLKREAVNVE